jgi:phosphoglucosamine mutase
MEERTICMLFGSSGIRQKFSKNLIDIALHAGSAVAKNNDTIVLGTDTRTTSCVLRDAFTSGCLSGGALVRTCGVVPTPLVAYNTRNSDAGCMITASHNPEEYNGIKLFNPDGSSFTRFQQEALETDLGRGDYGTWMEQGSLEPFDGVTPYKSAILDRSRLDREIRIILDCGSGAASALSPGLLSELGVEVVSVNCHQSGFFPRQSEPLEENLSYIPELIKKTGAKGAVVHDGDADRMMAFDERGRYIDGDHLLMLFVQYIGARKVVTTADASMAVEETAEVRRTPVGDSYVSEELLRWGEFGGEPSGAWIFPRHSLCPDGPYAAALFSEIASQWNVAETLDEMPHYPLLRDSERTENSREIMTAIGADNPTDGIRLTYDDGWCLIRASGTEPRIRFTAEGKTPRAAKEILRKGHDIVRRGKTA